MATTKRSKTVDIPYVLCRGDSDPFTHQARPDSDRTLCGQVAGERVRRRVMACAAWALISDMVAAAAEITFVNRFMVVPRLP